MSGHLRVSWEVKKNFSATRCSVNVALSKGVTIKLEQYNQPAPAREMIPGLIPQAQILPSSLWWAWLVPRPSSLSQGHPCQYPFLPPPYFPHKGCAASQGHHQHSFLGWGHKSHASCFHSQPSPRAAAQSMRKAHTRDVSQPPHQRTHHHSQQQLYTIHIPNPR